MKKMILFAALAIGAVTAQAQTDNQADPTLKYSVETNSFWSNWFISAGATYNAFYTGVEKGMNDQPGMFDGSRSAVGASFAIGKWFTPGFGLRTKATGIWGRYVSPDANGSLKNKSHNSYKYWTAQEQMLFNLSNLLCGYNECRVWNFIPYVGFGVTRNMTANDYAHGWSAGLLNTFKVSKRLAVNLEVGMNLSDDRLFDAAQTTHSDYGTYFTGFDRSFSAELGLTLNIGKTGWKKSPDVDAIKALSQQEIDALNNRLRASEDSKARMAADKDAKIADLERALAACQSTPVAVTNNNTPMPATAAVAQKKSNILQPTVVFRKNISTIDASQYANVEMVAKYMRNHPDAKVLIQGYASIEGDKDLNQKLSEERAESVRKALVNRYKIDAKRLSAQGFGATDSLFDDIEFNRIVTFSDTTK